MLLQQYMIFHVHQCNLFCCKQVKVYKKLENIGINVDPEIKAFLLRSDSFPPFSTSSSFELTDKASMNSKKVTKGGKKKKKEPNVISYIFKRNKKKVLFRNCD